VQRSIRQVAAESSVIMVAHRLSSIRHADQILVLEAGRVRELGRHDELVAHDGLYASLWALQQGEGPLGGSFELKLVPPEERR
jgi:ATP-binding cassette subfamily B protein